MFGVYSWSRKLGQAIAGGLVEWALGWIGDQPGGVEQSQSVLDGIYTLGTLVPALLLVSLLALVFWYPLTKKRVDENVAILEERHAAAAASASEQA